MEAIERLAIESECTRLINRLSRYTDIFAYEEAVALFADDCVFSRADVVHKGKDAILSAMNHRAPDRRTCHLTSGIVIDVIDADHATGEANALVFGHKGALTETGEAPLVSPDSIIRNEAEFVRTADGWRFRKWHIGLNFRKAVA